MKKNVKKSDTKRLIVAIPELLVQKLNEEKEKRGYADVQTIINEAIRDRYFRARETKVSEVDKLVGKKPYKGKKRGRKPRLDHLKMISGKNIFK